MGTDHESNAPDRHTITPEEEAWREMERRQRESLFTFAAHNAGGAAQKFIDESTKAELGIFTLRKAFEMGYIRGALAAYKGEYK